MTNLSKKIILVEGKDDKTFFSIYVQRVFNELSKNIQIKDLGGINFDSHKNNLSDELQAILASPNIKKTQIGIILDIDSSNISERIDFVNRSIEFSINELSKKKIHWQNVQEIPFLKSTNQWAELKDLGIKFAVHFVQVENQGEISDLLRAIKKENVSSACADCLAIWKNCVEMKNIEIQSKELSKLWLNVFLRYDICNEWERRNAHKNCSLETVLKEKDIFDFHSEIMQSCKEFFHLFLD